MENFHQKMMRQALLCADDARSLDEVPVGAVFVKEGAIIAKAYNKNISFKDPSAHAEILVLREGARRMNNYRLPGCDLYVTIEPCAMCAGAMVHARIRKLYFGANEAKAGVIVSREDFFNKEYLNHRPQFEGGILAEECSDKITAFFAAKRKKS